MKTSNNQLVELVEKVINWHTSRYPEVISNTPSNESLAAIQLLCEKVLLPVQIKFGQVDVTYGFTSTYLLNLIKKKNSKGIAPKLDQHASCEVNSKNNLHCDRFGAACDFIVAKHENDMHIVADWINENLSFDRVYFYGTNRPIHVSVGPSNSQFIQIMGTSKSGKRIPKKKGTKIKFADLWEE